MINEVQSLTSYVARNHSDRAYNLDRFIWRFWYKMCELWFRNSYRNWETMLVLIWLHWGMFKMNKMKKKKWNHFWKPPQSIKIRKDARSKSKEPFRLLSYLYEIMNYKNEWSLKICDCISKFPTPLFLSIELTVQSLQEQYSQISKINMI